MHLSVIIPTHNPDPDRLRRALLGLRAQTLPVDRWETVLVNNASTQFPESTFFGVHAPANFSLVHEPTLGLTAARRHGFLVARGNVAVLVDDDNVLAPDYLDQVTTLFARLPRLGLAGGKSVPDFERLPLGWEREFLPLLALRDLGANELISCGLRPPGSPRNTYPAFAPIGAGMALRREAWSAWLNARQTSRTLLCDRRGLELTSGGDNDLVLCALRAGWEVGYFPALILTHLIPATRLEPGYLARLNRGVQQSWMQVLALHDASPWPPLSRPGARLRKAKAWLTYHPGLRPLRAFAGREPAATSTDVSSEPVPEMPRNPANPNLSSPTLARALGLGRAVYRLWHQPRAAIHASIVAGGPLQQWITSRGHTAMTEAAGKLPTFRANPAPHLPELHFLTGRRFWDQTAFCLHSLQTQSGLVFHAVLHDDGTLDPTTVDQLRALFPHAEVRQRADNDARLAVILPPDRFPFLHDRRRHYPNILKLTDVHAGAHGWQLVLDSDMLFFRRPDFLLGWLNTPDRPLYMVDVEDSYGYPLPLMAELAGAAIPHLVNVGLAGLQSHALDWEKIEFWCRRLIETHGTSYYLEQALVAMLVAGQSCAVAPAADYVLAPGEAECRAPRAVLHHYVANSKRGYFRHGWRHVA